MNKHTPGPWEVRGYDVYQKHGRHICYNGPHHTQDSKYPPACKLQDEANARLIASAPELLEMLKIAMFCLPNAKLDWAPKARRLIKQVEGEE